MHCQVVCVRSSKTCMKFLLGRRRMMREKWWWWF
jgi:hypothetical protein